MGMWIVCCSRCLHSLRSEAKSERATILGDEVWVCADAEECAKRQEENKVTHREEIDRRLRYLKMHHALVVILDKFGDLFGYSNYFPTVAPGDDLGAVIQESAEHPDLVVSKVIYKHGCMPQPAGGQ